MSRRRKTRFINASEALQDRCTASSGPGADPRATMIGELLTLARGPANRHERRGREKRIKALTSRIAQEGGMNSTQT